MNISGDEDRDGGARNGTGHRHRVVRSHLQSLDRLHQSQPRVRSLLRRGTGRRAVWPCVMGWPTSADQRCHTPCSIPLGSTSSGGRRTAACLLHVTRRLLGQPSTR
jgi:hypothetical protein